MKIKVWMGITFASLLLMSGGLLAGGAIDATLWGNHGVSAVKAEFTNKLANTEPPEPMLPSQMAQVERPEPMMPKLPDHNGPKGMPHHAPVVAETEAPEPMSLPVVG